MQLTICLLGLKVLDIALTKDQTTEVESASHKTTIDPLAAGATGPLAQELEDWR